MKRTAYVIWKGTVKEGRGELSTQSNTLYKTPFTWNSRFENRNGTNPEELIAAAHAGCFSMKLSSLLTEHGYNPEVIETTVVISMDNNSINNSHIIVRATVPGISIPNFKKITEDAKNNCLISKALNVVTTIESILNEIEIA